LRELTFNDNELIVSKTDISGNITYGNELFMKLSGYSASELSAAPHNIIRHPSMPRIVFKKLWDTVKAGQEINAYVINQSKDGSYYWVIANVTPSYNNDGKIIGFHSVRRKPSKRALDIIKPLYKQLVQDEKAGGMQQSENRLNSLIQSNGGRYDKFILSI